MPSALRGNRSFSGSPFSGLYAAAEGSLVVVVANTPQQTEALLRALGLDLLWEDQRVQDWRNHPDVSELLGDRMQQAFMERTADAWEDLLAPAAPRGASRLCRQ
jgi:crotonobetainyl-CoA:carnitine CoA-transferase CaiB-like acyl-CoA transferase